MRGINLPQTFERRGTTVPFHQKDLGHTRVREYFHGQERILEAAIPNFSGGRRGELVIVPWEQLPGITALDQRDQRVHERIMEIGRAHSELQSLMRTSYAVFCLKK